LKIKIKHGKVRWDGFFFYFQKSSFENKNTTRIGTASDSSISHNFGYPFFVKIRRFFRRAPLDDATPGEHNQPAACQEDLSEQSS
jgi:hypothetical protein